MRLSPHLTHLSIWITPEASVALNEASVVRDISRGAYVQRAIWRAVQDHATRERNILLPPPTSTARYRFQNHKPGHGRWSKWVNARATVHNSVPLLLTKAARAQGFGSGSACLRYHLAILIKEDTGKTVPMPPGRSPADLFGGQIDEGLR